MIFICPGQDKRNLKIRNFKCRHCGYDVEFFSDELKRRCPQCKVEVIGEHLATCLDWCQYAESCVGKTRLKKYREDKKVTQRERG